MTFHAIPFHPRDNDSLMETEDYIRFTVAFRPYRGSHGTMMHGDIPFRARDASDGCELVIPGIIWFAFIRALISHQFFFRPFFVRCALPGDW